MASNRAVYMGSVVVGSTIGAYVPVMFGIGLFSYTSIASSAIFAALALYLSYKFLG